MLRIRGDATASPHPLSKWGAEIHSHSPSLTCWCALFFVTLLPCESFLGMLKLWRLWWSKDLLLCFWFSLDSSINCRSPPFCCCLFLSASVYGCFSCAVCCHVMLHIDEWKWKGGVLYRVSVPRGLDKQLCFISTAILCSCSFVRLLCRHRQLCVVLCCCCLSSWLWRFRGTSYLSIMCVSGTAAVIFTCKYNFSYFCMKQSCLSRPLGTETRYRTPPFHFHSSICSMTW
jgi:hypothetical protein